MDLNTQHTNLNISEQASSVRVFMIRHPIISILVFIGILICSLGAAITLDPQYSQHKVVVFILIIILTFVTFATNLLLENKFREIVESTIVQAFGQWFTKKPTTHALHKIEEYDFMKHIRQSQLLTGSVTASAYGYSTPTKYGHLEVSFISWRQGTGVSLFFSDIVTASEIYLIMEQDDIGQGVSSPIGQLLGIGEVEETELEWNDFEKYFRVLSNQPTITRRILTPDVMEFFHDWYQTHKLSIGISIGLHGVFIYVENNILNNKSYWHKSVTKTVHSSAAELQPVSILVEKILAEIEKRDL